MNVFELFAKIGLDSSEYEKGLGKAASMGKSVIGGIGNIAKVGFGAVTAAVGAGTAAVGAFGAQAVKAYSNYEQLEGGVKKLYGESKTAFKTMMANADKAYMSAGMSANEYMDTAMQFSASMISSLGGDLEQAANMTDVAMRAMSDNINTFGSDAESVTNAFKGFSKGQFMMLDNLKLGYGGTKTEMERLLRDAEKYEGYIENSLSVDNFSDIVDAIQIVQEHLNIAGTTQNEAMKTIEGSANATKAAWQNVITAIGKGEGLSDAFNGLKTAIFGEEEGEGLLNQVIPRIQTTMSGIGDFIAQSSPLISEKIPELINAILPDMITGGISLAESLGSGVISALPALGAAISEAGGIVGTNLQNLMETAVTSVNNFDFSSASQSVMDKIVSFFESDGVARFTDTAFQLVGGLISGLGESAPAIIPAAIRIVTSLVTNIISNIPTLVSAGIDLVGGLAQGIIQAIPTMLNADIQLWSKMFEVEAQLGETIVTKGKEIFEKLVDATKTALMKVPEVIAYWIGYAVGKFASEGAKFNDKAREIFDKVIEKVKAFVKSFADHAPKSAKEFKDGLINGLKELPSKMLEMGKNIIGSFIEGLKARFEELKSIGSNIASLFNAGKSAGEASASGNALKNAGRPTTSRIETKAQDVFATTELFDYEELSKNIVNAFINANIGVDIDGREFGRLVRKAVTV